MFMSRKSVSDGTRRPGGVIRRNIAASFGKKCVHCGADLSENEREIHIDHWIPRKCFEKDAVLGYWLKYRDRYFNLVCSCRTCNMRKGATPPAMGHPLSVRFFLHCCGEEMLAAWMKNEDVPPTVLEYWASHETLERDGVETLVNDRKLEVIQRIINERFQEKTDHHYIDFNLLHSHIFARVAARFNYDIRVLTEGWDMAMSLFSGKDMPSLGQYQGSWDHDCWFIGECWPAMCAGLVNGRWLEPTPRWERPCKWERAYMFLDSQDAYFDELAGCKD